MRLLPLYNRDNSLGAELTSERRSAAALLRHQYEDSPEMINWSGIAAFASALKQPQLLQPRLVIHDITRLDWAQVRAKGYTGIVIDKDNCITEPHSDRLVPRLAPAWAALLSAFGPENVLIVSNSAGSSKDSLGLQAEALARNTGVPVLVHKHFKPSRRCIDDITDYFLRRDLLKAVRPHGSTPRSSQTSADTDSRLLVIGDRISTDMILANRLRKRVRASGVLTTGLHAKESLGTTVLRRAETWLMRRHASVAVSTNEEAKEREELRSCVAAPAVTSEASTTSTTSRARELWRETQEAWDGAVIDRALPFRRWESMFGRIEDGITTRSVKRVGGLVEKARWMGAKWQLGLSTPSFTQRTYRRLDSRR